MTAVQMSIPSRVRAPGIATVDFDAEACRQITAAMAGGLDIAFRCGPGLVLDVRPRARVGTALQVRGTGTGLCVDSAAIPMAVAAVLLAIQEATGIRPRCLFPWPRHRWLTITFGLTGTAAQVRQVLLRTEPDERRRPIVQVGD